MAFRVDEISGEGLRLVGEPPGPGRGSLIGLTVSRQSSSLSSFFC